MADSVVDALGFDLLEWLSTRERSYEEVMDASGVPFSIGARRHHDDHLHPR
jgi:hypothetical protein